MKAMLAIAAKDLRLLVRDRASVVFSLLFPLVLAVFFGTIFGGAGEDGAKAMPVALVDEARSDASRELATTLAASPALSARPMARAEAEGAVRNGKLVAYILLGPPARSSHGLMAEMPEVTVGIDPARSAEAGYLRGLLMEALFTRLQASFAAPEKLRGSIAKSLHELDGPTNLPVEQSTAVRDFLTSFDRFLGEVDPQVMTEGGAFPAPSVTVIPVTAADTGPRSAFEVSFPQAMIWGLIGTAAAFAVTLVTERVSGTLLRLRLAPIRRTQILGGKGLACFAACAASVLTLLVIGRLLFGVRIANPLGLALAVPSAALAFTGLMMLVSTIGRTPSAVGGASWAVLLVMSMLGGGMVPLIAMPPWMRSLAGVSPVKWAVLALEGAIWRGFSMAEMLVPCAILVGVGLVAFRIGAYRLARAER